MKSASALPSIAASLCLVAALHSSCFAQDDDLFAKAKPLLTKLSKLNSADWQAALKQELPLLGHRNWIVIADSAYPWQTASGIETINTGADQLDVVKSVLDALAKTSHVRANIFTDAEMPLVAEADAPGVGAYREGLAELLKKQGNTVSLPHDQIIAKLDEAGKAFHVLLLKTKLTIPYTSVFLQLDCAYWNAVAEKRLRDAMAK